MVGRPRRTVLRQHRPRADRPGGGCRRADGPPRLCHQLGQCPPAVNRGGVDDRRLRPRRPLRGVLRQFGLRSRRVGAQVRPQLPPLPGRRGPLQGHRPQLGLPRHHPRSPRCDRHPEVPRPVPPHALGRRPTRAQHPPVHLARRHAGRRSVLCPGRRGGDPGRGPRDRRRGHCRAGPERRRRPRAPRRLLAGTTPHLRPPRGPPCR